MKYPIIYKTLKVQFAFYVHEDGKLETTMVNAGIQKEQKFKSEKEARDYVESLKEVL